MSVVHLEDLFDHELGAAIRVGDAVPRGRVFRDGHGRRAIHLSAAIAAVVAAVSE